MSRYNKHSFERFSRRKPGQPRRIRGGVKLRGKLAPEIDGWTGRRWMRLIEDSAPVESQTQGLELARAGQTKSIEFASGAVIASVQDEEAKAHCVRLEMPAFSTAQWDEVLGRLEEQAIYAAKFLAGELPVNIQDLFAPSDVSLFPETRADMSVSCDCADSEREPWCKHVCCAAFLTSEAIDRNPFLMLRVRGQDVDELLDRLRRRRAVVGADGRATPVYEQREITAAGSEAPLETCLEGFWTCGPCDAEPTAPEVDLALLRRLGPSPLGGSFPMVGLLATCYEVISERARAQSAEEPGGSGDPL